MERKQKINGIKSAYWRRGNARKTGVLKKNEDEEKKTNIRK